MMRLASCHSEHSEAATQRTRSARPGFQSLIIRFSSVLRESKAPEHRRTPKRKRGLDAELAATFWSAALLRRFRELEGPTELSV
jgi:hypothetical protein